jgi:hypothetical protein
MKWLFSWLALGLLGCGAFAAPGRPCQKHEECDGLENGYCARAEICTRECSETAPCPESSTCSNQGRRSVCLPTCDSEDDCLPNFSCYQNVCSLKNPLDPPPK